MSETCDYQSMSHKIASARPYVLLTQPQFWLTRRAWTYHDLRKAYADRFDSKRIGNAYARSVFRSCADAVIQEAVGNANLTWTPWLRPKSTGCQSWANWSSETWFAYALLTRSLRGAYANLRHQTCKKNMTANTMKFSKLQSGPNLNTTNSEKSSKRLLSPRSG